MCQSILTVAVLQASALPEKGSQQGTPPAYSRLRVRFRSQERPAFDSASALGSLKYEVSGFWRMVSLDMLGRGCRKIRNMQVPRVLATLHVPFHLDDNNQRQMFAGVLKPSGFCATGREGPVAKPDTAT